MKKSYWCFFLFSRVLEKSFYQRWLTFAASLSKVWKTRWGFPGNALFFLSCKVRWYIKASVQGKHLNTLGKMMGWALSLGKELRGMNAKWWLSSCLLVSVQITDWGQNPLAWAQSIYRIRTARAVGCHMGVTLPGCNTSRSVVWMKERASQVAMGCFRRCLNMSLPFFFCGLFLS